MESLNYFVAGVAVLALLSLIASHVRGGSEGLVWSWAELRHLVIALVLEAEQTMQGDSGEEKLSWVLNRAEEIGVTRLLPIPVLSAFVESTVYRIHHWGDGADLEKVLGGH